jgi:hypothetical protein
MTTDSLALLDAEPPAVLSGSEGSSASGGRGRFVLRVLSPAPRADMPPCRYDPSAAGRGRRAGVAPDFDPTVDAVVTDLAHRGVPVFSTDLAELPQRLRLDAHLADGRWSGRLINDHRCVELDKIRAIWRRNPSPYSLPDSLGPEKTQFGFLQAATGADMIAAMADLLATGTL